MSNPYLEKLQGKLPEVAKATEEGPEGNPYLEALLPKLNNLPAGDETQETTQPQRKQSEKPRSGYGASLKEGAKALVRNQLQFNRGADLATDTKATAARHQSAQKKGTPSVLQSLNTPGQNEEIGRAISQGKDPETALNENRAGRVSGYEAELEKWATDPNYNPPDEGFAKFTHDVVNMVPQVGAQVAVGILTGGVGSATFMGGQIAGGQMEQLEKDGVTDPVVRFKAGMANAGMQAPMEALAMGKLLNIWKPGKAAAKILRDWTASGATEFGTEFLQGLPEHATTVWAKTEGKGMNFSERMDTFIEGLDEAMKQSAYEGLVATVPGMGFGAVKIYADREAYKSENKKDEEVPPGTASPENKDAASKPGVGMGSDLASATGAREDRQKASPASDAIDIVESGEDLSHGLVHKQLTQLKLAQQVKAKEKAEREARAAEVSAKEQLAKTTAMQAEAAVSQEISKQRAIQSESMEDYENLQSQRLENDHMKAARMENERWMQALEHPQMQPQVVNGLISELENAQDKKDEQGRMIARPLGTQFAAKEANFVGGLLRQAHKAVTLQNVDTKKVDEILYDLDAATGVIGADPKTQSVTDLLKGQLTELRSALEVTEEANAEAKSKTQKSVQSTVDRFKQRLSLIHI